MNQMYSANQALVIRIPYHYETHDVGIAYYQYEEWRIAISILSGVSPY